MMHAGPSLTAPTWWKYNEGKADISVGETPGPLGKQGECTADSYVAQVPRDPLQWDSDFRVGRVFVAGQLLVRLQQHPGLKLRILHAGAEVSLDSTHPTSESFRCLPYGGDWTLMLSVTPGLACVDDPILLTIQVDTICGQCSPAP